MSSIKFALRSLSKAPGFAAAAVFLIAIGLAASTTAFTLVNTLFFKPRHGLADPAALYNVHPSRAAGDFGSWSYPDFRAAGAEATQFSGLAAFSGVETGLAVGARSISVKTTLSSANYFDVLGVTPATGRFFLPDDEATVGASPVAVISNRLWQSEFGGADDTVGRTVKVNGDAFTIIGIAPAGFHGTFIGYDVVLWLPLSMSRVIGSEVEDHNRPSMVTAKAAA
jgi:hypothetical protein